MILNSLPSGGENPNEAASVGKASETRPVLLDPSVLGNSVSLPATSRDALPRAAFKPLLSTDLNAVLLGRNTFFLDGVENVDFGIAKIFSMPWEGHKLTKEEATERSGIKTVKWLSDLPTMLHGLMCDAEQVYLNSNEHKRAVVDRCEVVGLRIATPRETSGAN